MLHTLAIATRRSGGKSRKYAPTVVGVTCIDNLRPDGCQPEILPESGRSPSAAVPLPQVAQ
jgi:hypothetical protein